MARGKRIGVVCPVPHAGILLGPTLNIATAGTNSESGGNATASDVDNRFSYYGLSASIALLF